MQRRSLRRQRPTLQLESLESRQLLAGDGLADIVQISEILAVNEDSQPTRTRDSASATFRGERLYPDWIELQNTSDQPVEIGGFSLTDDPQLPWKWQIPDSTTLAPHGFLVVFASGLDIRDAALDENQWFHTNFKLDAEGEYLALADEAGNVIDEWTDTPRQQSDVSFGLGPDGQTAYLIELTPEGPNSLPYLGAVADTHFSVDRGYFEQPFDVEILSDSANAQIRYTLDGSQPTATHGLVYTAPIRIDTTTNLRAAAFQVGYLPTDVDTHSYIFVNDVIRQPAEIPGFPFGGRTWAGQSAYVPQDSEMDPEVVHDPAYRDIIDDALLVNSDDLHHLRSGSDFFQSGLVRRRRRGTPGVGGNPLSPRSVRKPPGRRRHRIALPRPPETFVTAELSRSLRRLRAADRSLSTGSGQR